VKVDASHGRGIVLDGAHAGWDSHGNVVRNVVMTSGVRYTGIELVGSRDDVIENCTIDGVQGHGIRVRKAALSADQPNKKSSGNIVRNNVITRAGLDGVNVTSSDGTRVVGNTITSAGRAVTGPGGGRSGIRVTTLDGVPANRTVVSGNAVSDPLRWQRHGLDIDSPLAIGTVVTGNSFSGSRLGPIRDQGTGTLFP
jgi:parallel beta-helix repeat protein